MSIHPRRVRVLREGMQGPGPVVYWMSRDQRAEDNWALVHARERAQESGAPLVVVFCLAPEFLGATIRQYGFMLRGLEAVELRLNRRNIGFCLLRGRPDQEIPKFLQRQSAGLLVGDFSPLRVNREWKASVAARIRIPFHEVDAHNIVPCWAVSTKAEFAASTFRPKIQRLLPEFLDEFPALGTHRTPWGVGGGRTDWAKAERSLKVDRTVREADWLTPGPAGARAMLRTFIRERLEGYDELRNDPNQAGQSHLSPYLHFGHIAPQRVALEVRALGGRSSAARTFLEELIVRRELSDNFCFYNDQYDQFEGFAPWARRTLDAHRRDRREFLYSLEQFEAAATHDRLWNAAQKEVVETGKMHGYLRMYWAKKILEWTRSPEEALDVAIRLNDRYELDGRDPNGYAGAAWSIGGVHDRAWGERAVFGKIRFMSYNGCLRKFDVDAYVRRWT